MDQERIVSEGLERILSVLRSQTAGNGISDQ